MLRRISQPTLEVPSLTAVEDDDPPTVVRASEIRELSPSRSGRSRRDTQTDLDVPILWEDDDDEVEDRAGTMRMIGLIGARQVDTMREPTSYDEALSALVARHVERAKARPVPEAPPAPRARSVARALARLTRSTRTLESWLRDGGLRARVGFVVGCAVLSSVMTAVLAR